MAVVSQDRFYSSINIYIVLSIHTPRNVKRIESIDKKIHNKIVTNWIPTHGTFI